MEQVGAVLLGFALVVGVILLKLPGFAIQWRLGRAALYLAVAANFLGLVALDLLPRAQQAFELSPGAALLAWLSAVALALIAAYGAILEIGAWFHGE